MVSRFCILLFSLLDHILPWINPSVLVGPRHPVNWRSENLDTEKKIEKSRFGWPRMSGRRTSGSSRAKSGSSGSCRLFLHFLGKIAVQEMSGRTPGSPRHPCSRHPCSSDRYPKKDISIPTKRVTPKRWGVQSHFLGGAEGCHS